MVWSLALVRRPSSRRIAARTESPSWTRAARREGCGWGKWVISYVYCGTHAERVTDYGSRVSGFPRPMRVSTSQLLPFESHAEALLIGYCPGGQAGAPHASHHRTSLSCAAWRMTR